MRNDSSLDTRLANIALPPDILAGLRAFLNTTMQQQNAANAADDTLLPSDDMFNGPNDTSSQPWPSCAVNSSLVFFFLNQKSVLSMLDGFPNRFHYLPVENMWRYLHQKFKNCVLQSSKINPPMLMYCARFRLFSRNEEASGTTVGCCIACLCREAEIESLGRLIAFGNSMMPMRIDGHPREPVLTMYALKWSSLTECITTAHKRNQAPVESVGFLFLIMMR